MLNVKNIIDDTNPLIREKSIEVPLPLNDEDAKLLDDMMEYLILSQDEEKAKEFDLAPGVGIAAIQLGIKKRMFCIYTVDEKGNEQKYALVNPKIISYSIANSYLSNGEGCLSVPTPHEGYVKRHLKIKIKAYDHISNKEVVLSFKDYVAIVIQHEYDHLDGILYYDHINKKAPFEPIKDAKVI